MNYRIEEHLVEEHRKNIRREIGLIYLERQALQGKVFRPNWFTRAMQSFGQLLITQGEGLVKRYEIPTKKACQQAGRRYAH